MFTDMVGYQDVLRQDESLGRYLLEKERSVIRQVSSGHGGRYFGEESAAAEGTGLKGWLTGGTVKIRETKLQSSESVVLFESGLDATRCAVEIQRMLREYNREAPSNKDIYVRIGIHVGDVTERDGQASGEAVAIASRVAPAAESGGICVSEKVYRNVRDKLGFPIVRLGRQELKNVDVPIEVYKIALPWEKQAPGEPAAFDPHRLAVLPFANISPDAGDEYFADGMTEELILTMSKISGLRVIARTSVMGYKGGQKKISEVAKELEVGTVLEGSVRKSGDKLRITVQLIDSQTNDHLWAESYDRELRDVFAIQSEISKTVADALKVRLLADDKERMEKEPTKNTEAYTLYLKGRYYRNMGKTEDLHKARDYFLQSLEKDPLYAQAYAGLADYYSVLPFYTNSPPKEVFPKAEAAVKRALELDNSNASAHAALAYLRTYYDWKFGDADEEFQRALNLNPNDATVHQRYSRYLVSLGRIDDALREINLAQQLDPLSLLAKANAGMIYFFSHDYDSAVLQLRKVLQEDPKFPVAHWGLGLVYEQKRNIQEALAEFEAAASVERNDVNIITSLAHAYALAGQKDRAGNFIQELQAHAKQEYVSGYHFAVVYLGLGEKDAALASLEEAFRDRSTLLIYLKMDPRFDSLRSDSRFIDLLRRIGL